MAINFDNAIHRIRLQLLDKLKRIIDSVEGNPSCSCKIDPVIRVEFGASGSSTTLDANEVSTIDDGSLRIHGFLPKSGLPRASRNPYTIMDDDLNTCNVNHLLMLLDRIKA